MASARCFAIQTLRKAVLVIGRTNVEESNALETRVRCDLALLKQDFNKHSLQDQVLILEALEYYQDLPRDMTSILEELHQSLSGPITGSLLEQVKFLRQVLSLREYLLRHAERTLMGDSYRPVKAQLGEILVLLDHRLTKIQEELRGYRSETMEADVVLLDALFDLVIQVEYDRPDDPNAGLEHDIALLLARVEPCAVAQKQDDKVRLTKTKPP